MKKHFFTGILLLANSFIKAQNLIIKNHFIDFQKSKSRLIYFISIFFLLNTGFCQDNVKAESYFKEGLDKSDDGDCVGAIALFSKAINLSADKCDYYYYRGSEKYDCGDYAGAVSDYTKCLKLKPNSNFYYSMRAVAKLKLSDYKGAIIDYNKSLANIEPTTWGYDSFMARNYYNRGLAKSNLGDFNGALKDYNKAIKHEPNDPFYYRGRGFVKLKLGLKTSGCLDFSKAGELGDETIYTIIKNNCN